MQKIYKVFLTPWVQHLKPEGPSMSFLVIINYKKLINSLYFNLNYFIFYSWVGYSSMSNCLIMLFNSFLSLLIYLLVLSVAERIVLKSFNIIMKLFLLVVLWNFSLFILRPCYLVCINVELYFPSYFTLLPFEMSLWSSVMCLALETAFPDISIVSETFV